MKIFFLILLSLSLNILNAQDFRRPYYTKPGIIVGAVQPAPPASNNFTSVLGKNASAVNSSYWASGFRNASLLTNKSASTGTIYADLLTDVSGLWRLTLSAAVSATDKDTTPDLQTFLNGGGNAILKAACPLIDLKSTTDPEKRNISLLFAPRIGMVLPMLGSTSSSPNINFDPGFEVTGNLIGQNNLIGLCITNRTAFTFSDSKSLNAMFKTNESFAWGQVRAGIILRNEFMISYNIPYKLYETPKMLTENGTTVSVSLIF